MDWKSLEDKQKKQYIILAVVFLGVIFKVVQLAMPSGEEGVNPKIANASYEELDQERMSHKRLLSKEESIIEEYERAIKELKQINENYLSPKLNTLTWASEKIYKAAKKVNITIETLEEYRTRSSFEYDREKAGKSMEPFGVRVITSCSYMKMIEFVSYLEESNPYISISQINLQGNDSNPQAHTLAVIIEWPSFASEEDIKRLTQEGSS